MPLMLILLVKKFGMPPAAQVRVDSFHVANYTKPNHTIIAPKRDRILPHSLPLPTKDSSSCAAPISCKLTRHPPPSIFPSRPNSFLTRSCEVATGPLGIRWRLLYWLSHFLGLRLSTPSSPSAADSVFAFGFLASDLGRRPSLQFLIRTPSSRKLQIKAVGSTFGTHFRVTTFGESHGGGVGCIVDGCPPWLPFSEADLQLDLDRRVVEDLQQEKQLEELHLGQLLKRFLMNFRELRCLHFLHSFISLP
ncbi:hypothetical protein NL676_037279 [Syzygium grande]|nr:hypothetical protein NL676_037279 [Syzygium grande]